jgi:acetolactate synthase-1/2/3 large subunit
VDDATLQMPRLYRTRARLAPDPRAVEEAMELLAAAERPAMIAGSSVFWDDAWDELRAFVERAQIPTFLNGAGRGCLRPDHPLFFQHTRKEALSGADLVFVVGTPFDFRLNYGAEPTFSAASKIVQVDVDATEVGRNRAVEVGIVADSRSWLAAFAEGAKLREARAVPGDLRRGDPEARGSGAVDPSDAVPIHHYRLAREMSEVANAGSRDPISSPTAETGWRWRPRSSPSRRRGAGSTPARWGAWASERRPPSPPSCPPRAASVGGAGRRLVRPQRLRLETALR